MELFKDKMNLLFVSRIGEFLLDQDTRYIVKKFSDTEYFIQLEPAVYHGRLKDIYDMICYDYDVLPEPIKERFKMDYQVFDRVDGNLYQLGTKEYQIQSEKKK